MKAGVINMVSRRRNLFLNLTSWILLLLPLAQCELSNDGFTSTGNTIVSQDLTHSRAEATLFIENELYLSEVFNLLFSQPIDMTGLDFPTLKGDSDVCSDLNQILKPSGQAYYFNIDHKIRSSLIIHTCSQETEGILAYIQINPAALSFNSVSHSSKLLSKLFHSENYQAKIYNGSIQKNTQHEHRRRSLTTLEDEFGAYANETSVPVSINIFIYDVSLDKQFYDYMFTALSSYHVVSFESSAEFSIYGTAVINMMNSSFANASQIDSLEMMSGNLRSTTPDYMEYPDSIQTFIDIQALYLHYYSQTSNQFSINFLNAVRMVDESINNFIVNVTQGSSLTLENSLNFTSNYPSIDSTISIYYIKTVGSNITGCTCSFCDNTYVIGVLQTYYTGIFTNGDGFGLSFYNGGSVTVDEYGNPLTIVFTDEEELFAENNCVVNAGLIDVYDSYAPYGYECLNSLGANQGNCTALFNSSTLEYVSAAGYGVFYVQRICIDNCDLCPTNPDTCTECADSYFININNACSNCDNTCATCNAFGPCLTCKDYASLNNATGECICNKRYGLDSSSGNCLNCTDSACNYCTDDYSICLECIDGYYLEGDSCLLCDPTCATCDNGLTCNTCIDTLYGPYGGDCYCNIGLGFVANTADCHPCSDIHCSKCNSSYEICDVCNSGYFLNESWCIQCDLSCHTCANNSECESCKENAVPVFRGFCECSSLYGFNSAKDCLLCEDPNCLDCSNNYTECASCPDGYYLDSGECIKCNLDCITCNSSAGCIECRLHSTGPDELGKCPCNSNYGRNSTTGECESCEDHNCNLCANDYHICTQCFEAFFLNDTCQLCDSTCSTCSDALSCDNCKEHSRKLVELCACEPGYGRDTESNCSPCSSNCIDCTDNFEVCNTCNNQFFIDGVLCSLCDNTCSSCNNPDNCTQCWQNATLNELNYCICNDGYGLNEFTGLCMECDSNCNTCTTDYLKCSNCKAEYGLDPATLTCDLCMDNCADCHDNSSSCHLCNRGYYFDGFVCNACNNTCQECSSLTVCTMCWDNAYLKGNNCMCNNSFGKNENGTCSFCTDNKCSICTEDYNRCDVCQEPYGLKPELFICSLCSDSNCIACHDDSEICTECSDGYYLDSGACSICDKTCRTCNNSFTCDSCLGNATLQADNHCKCNLGYGFLYNGECAQCSQNCYSCYSNSSICDVCKEPYGLDPGLFTCTNCSDPNCVACHDNSDICTDCVSGYFLDLGGCAICNKTCRSCSDSLTCDTCLDNAMLQENNHCKCSLGYGFLDNGECAQCSSNCYSCYANSSICEVCNEPYGLNPGLFICAICSDPNCVMCNDNSEICTECSDGYYLNLGGCSPCDKTCKTCNDSLTCDTCLGNATLQVNNHCKCNLGFGFLDNDECDTCSANCYSCYSNSNICDVCNEPYGLNLDDFLCYSCENGCFNCSENSNSCQVCHPGYFLTGDLCDVCSDTCETCEHSADYCVSCNGNATLSEDDNTCSCNLGYGTILETGECTECDSKCKSCTNNYLQCNDCNDPYGLNRSISTCEICQAHCYNCHDDSSKCTNCSDGYFINVDSQCEICAESCKTCDINGCLTCFDNAELHGVTCSCNSGFGFDDHDQCQECNSNCNMCTENYFECTDCKDPLGLDHILNTCQVCGDNCLACHNNSSICNTCATGYFNNAGICTQCMGICHSCSSATTCDICGNNASGPFDGICTCENYYGISSNGSCQACYDDLCYDCNEDLNTCNTCTSNATKDSSHMCACNEYYGANGNTCNLCMDSLCQDCQDDYSICNTCVPNTGLSTAPCACISHSSFDSSSMQCECTLGYVLYESQCLPGKRFLLSENVQSVYFNSIFTALVFTFNTAVNTAVSSTCSKIFTSISGFGTSPTCNFQSSTVLNVNLGLGWNLNSDSDIIINSNYILRTSGLYYYSSPNIIVSPSYSVIPPAPSVVISGPLQYATSCTSTDLLYYSDKSTGIASESFLYSWSTDIVGGPTANTAAFDISGSAVIGLSSFTVYLAITDIFSNSTSISYPVTITDTRFLTVSLDSGSVITIASSQSLTILASVTNLCGLSGIPTYTWSSSPTMSSVLTASSISTKLLVNSKALAASSTAYVFTVRVSLQGVTGTASVSITVTSTPLVIIFNRAPGDITSSLGFVGSASRSYDPDNQNTVLSFSWTTSPTAILSGVSPVNSNAITIPGNNLHGYTSFVLTLIVSADIRSTSLSTKYAIVDNLNTVIAMTVPSSIPTTKQLTINTSITSTVGSTIIWSQLLGPSAVIKPTNYPYLSFQSNVLSPGTTYSFQIAVTESSGLYLRSYAQFTTNLGAGCTGALTSSTYSAKFLSNIYLSIANCKNLDNPSNIVQYTFGYIVGTKMTALGLSNSFSYINTILPIGSYTMYVTVTDIYGQGNQYKTSSLVVVKSSRNLKESNNILDQYKENLEVYGVISTQIFYLNSNQMSAADLSVMWNDFTQFTSTENPSNEVMENICNIVLHYMNDLQSPSNTIESIEKYASFVLEQLKKMSEVSPAVINQILEVYSRIYEINSNDPALINLVEETVDEIFSLINNPGANPIAYTSFYISIYKKEDFKTEHIQKAFMVRENSITVNNLDIEDNLIITVEVAAFESDKNSDIISLSITSAAIYNNYQIQSSPSIQISLNNGVDLEFTLYKAKAVQCQYISTEGTIETCSITSQDGLAVTVKALSNGDYYLIEAVASSLVPSYLIVGTGIIGMLFMLAFYIYERRSMLLEKPKLNITIESVTDRSFKGSSVQLETVIDSSRNPSSSELDLNQKTSDNSMESSKRILLITSTIMLEIFIQNLMLKNPTLLSSAGAPVIGLLSVLFVLPLNLICSILLRNENQTPNTIAYLLLLAVQFIAFIGGILIPFTNQWAYALFAGFLSELFGAQPIIYFARRLIK